LSLKEHVLVVVGNVSTFAGSYCIGTEQHVHLVEALLCLAKLLKGCISGVLGLGHGAIEQFYHSRQGMIRLRVCRAALVSCGGGITNMIQLGKQHLFFFHMVYRRIELLHSSDLAIKCHKVLLLVIGIV
jgi:hypothetical protein